MSFITPIQNVIVQKNYLEKMFRAPLEAALGFDRLCESDPIEARVGESKTLTQRAILPPITQDVVPAPAIYTDLNNGITPQQVTYEQYNTTIAKRRGMMTLDLELDFAKITSEYVRNWVDLAKQAAQSRDSRAATALFSAYDGGNTFAYAAGTLASGTLTVELDNINGFTTSYAAAIAAGGSPGVPVAVSAGNPLAAAIYPAATPNVPIPCLVINASPDATNVSTAYSAGAPYGVSGSVQLVNVPGNNYTLAMAVGDVLRATDGSMVLRPNGKISRAQLLGSDLATMSILSRAKGRLEARQVPKLPNGMYAAMIDSLLWSDLENDQAFQRATAGQWGQRSSFFQNGRTNEALGLEFVTTSLNPVYPIPGQNTGVVARHILVCGMGCIIKSPSIGFRRAANIVQGDDIDGVQSPGGATDVRLVDDVKMVTRQPLDPEATQLTQTWSWAMGHVAATDITSTPAIIPQTDNARYKRCVLIEVGSPS